MITAQKTHTKTPRLERAAHPSFAIMQASMNDDERHKIIKGGKMGFEIVRTLKHPKLNQNKGFGRIVRLRELGVLRGSRLLEVPKVIFGKHLQPRRSRSSDFA